MSVSIGNTTESTKGISLFSRISQYIFKFPLIIFGGNISHVRIDPDGGMIDLVLTKSSFSAKL